MVALYPQKLLTSQFSKNEHFNFYMKNPSDMAYMSIAIS